MSNAADEKQVKKASQRDELKGRQYDADFKWLMDHPQGRRLMWSWLEEAGVYQTSFTGNSHTFFNEGRRQVGLYRMADIHRLAPAAYLKMLNEANTPE